MTTAGNTPDTHTSLSTAVVVMVTVVRVVAIVIGGVSLSVSRRRVWTFMLAVTTQGRRFHADSVSIRVRTASCCSDTSADTTPSPSTPLCDVTAY